MKKSEAYSLMGDFIRLHYDMSEFLAENITVSYQNSVASCVNPKCCKRLFDYIMDDNPDFITADLVEIVSDNRWGLMFIRWWECMELCFHPEPEHRKTIYIHLKNKGITVKQMTRYLGDKIEWPAYEEIKRKRDKLLQILDYIQDFKLWVKRMPIKPYGPVIRKDNEQIAFAIPPELDTPQAREYLNKAQEAGFVDERYQPIKGQITKVQMKLFAAYCSAACNIMERHWKVFEELWSVKDLQKVKEEQGSPAKAKAIADLFPSEVVEVAKDRFNLLV